MRTYQSGVGLMEVLVALFVLAIGVLGFIALQYRAVEAGSEASSRIIATNIARDIAEKIRMNNSTDALVIYANAGALSDSMQCYTQVCNATNKAKSDIKETQDYANRLDMRLAIIACPATQNNRQCIYVAWGKTDPVDNTATSGHIPCTTSGNGQFKYNDDSTCLVMEAY